MIHELFEFVIFLFAVVIAIISIRKMFGTFEKGSMLGDLAHGYILYIIITVLLQVFVFSAILYNKIYLGVVLQPATLVETPALLLLLVSYILLYRETSHFKKREEREFGAKVSEQDLVKFGFVKAVALR